MGDCAQVKVLGQHDAILVTGVLDDIAVGHVRNQDFAHPGDVMSQLTQIRDRARPDIDVGEEPHATADVRSLASQAP